ncbi:unnamed protein product [Callosobruchus maculatus]|uniref:Uncharacterized protein n=1 Tax=Callosobruchus maculatus TaxID=64391 RepID=A0A653CGT7_CALMS|nr:unnamed protein product [Callosobruchus maculatus]
MLMPKNVRVLSVVCICVYTLFSFSVSLMSCTLDKKI